MYISQTKEELRGFSGEILIEINIRKFHHEKLSWIEVNSAMEDQVLTMFG